jgi:hypothetical protein
MPARHSPRPPLLLLLLLLCLLYPPHPFCCVAQRKFLEEYEGADGRRLHEEEVEAMCAANGQSLPISYLHLSHHSPVLAIWLADVPKLMLEMFDEVATSYVESRFSEYWMIHPDIHVRITQLPVSDSLRELRITHVNALVKVAGVVTKRSPVFPQLKIVHFNCLGCGNTTAPMVQGDAVEARPGDCAYCQKPGPWVLNQEQTVYRNYQRVTLQESPGAVPAGRVPRSKEVILTADLVDGVRRAGRVGRGEERSSRAGSGAALRFPVRRAQHNLSHGPAPAPLCFYPRPAAGAPGRGGGGDGRVRAHVGRGAQHQAGLPRVCHHHRGQLDHQESGHAVRVQDHGCVRGPRGVVMAAKGVRCSLLRARSAQPATLLCGSPVPALPPPPPPPPPRRADDDKRQIAELAKDPHIRKRIAKSIAPSIYGNDFVKMAVALSMFGGREKNVNGKHRIRGDINVLLLGDPGTAKSQVLKYVEKTAPRAVYTTGKGASAVGLTAAVHKDPMSGEWTLEGAWQRVVVEAGGGWRVVDGNCERCAYVGNRRLTARPVTW